jgi:hypothetical protein
MKCPSCGAVYEQTELQFLGQQDGYFLLSMTCSKCSLPVWVNVFAGGTATPLTDLTILDFDLLQKEPISKDEVISFHKSIRLFDGNFQKAFRKH